MFSTPPFKLPISFTYKDFYLYKKHFPRRVIIEKSRRLEDLKAVKLTPYFNLLEGNNQYLFA